MLEPDEEAKVQEIEDFFKRILQYKEELPVAKQAFEDTLSDFEERMKAWKKEEEEIREHNRQCYKKGWQKKEMPPRPKHPEAGAYLTAQGNLLMEERALKEYAGPEYICFLLGLVRKLQQRDKIGKQIAEIFDPAEKEICVDCKRPLSPKDLEFYEQEFGKDRFNWDRPYCARCSGDEEE